MKKVICVIAIIACSTSAFFAQRGESTQLRVTLEKQCSRVLYVCSAQCHGTAYLKPGQCPKCKKPLMPTMRKG
jgi:hypothetical protein